MTKEQAIDWAADVGLKHAMALIAAVHKDMDAAKAELGDFAPTAMVTAALAASERVILQTTKAMASGVPGPLQPHEHRRLFVSACNQIRASGVAARWPALIMVPINLENPDGQ